MIGDFCGMKFYLDLMGFQDKNFFWSTMDLGKYCLESGYKDIKIRGETSEKVVYSSLKALHRQEDYTRVTSADVYGKFCAWLEKMARETENGDVVNIIMICHGSTTAGKQGDLEMGDSRVKPEDLVDLMRKFKNDVQINFVTNACGSGGICSKFPATDQQKRLIVAVAAADEQSSGNGLVGWTKGHSTSGRYRSSFFMDVIIKSLGKINLDGNGPTIATLRQDFQTGVFTNPIAPPHMQAKSHPQLGGSSSGAANAKTSLQQILHMDYVDYPHNPTRAARFLRQELNWQVVTQKPPGNIDEWGFGNCRDEVRRFLEWEVKKSTSAHARDLGDAALLGAMDRVLNPQPQGRKWSVAQVLRGLMLRAKIQSSFFSTFLHLTDILTVTFEGLQQPMDPSRPRDEQVQTVAGALQSFSGIQKFSENWRKDPHLQGFETFFAGMDGYTAPMNWLATLIVRGAVVEDFYALMDRIEIWGEFGKLDRVKLGKVWPKGRKLRRNINADVVQRWTGNRDSPVVAFWLPHDAGKTVTREAIYRQFDEKFFVAFEDLFFRFFGELPGSDLPNFKRPASHIKKDIKDGKYD